MKRFCSLLCALLLTVCLLPGTAESGDAPQAPQEAIQQMDFQTFCIKAHFAGTYDTDNLVFFIKEDDYIIPVRLQKRDLGAENRFLAMDLKEGDVVIVKGMLRDIDVNGEK